MQPYLQLLPYLMLFLLGVLFAKRWLVTPKLDVAKFSKKTRWVSLILFCWLGMFVAGFAARIIGWWLSDGIAFDEGAEMAHEVAHDGTGDNVFSLMFGWSLGFICWGIARVLPKSKAAPN